MTGLYSASIAGYKSEANKRVRRCEDSLSSLQNQDGEYAQEHKALLSVLKKVAQIFNNCPDDINGD